MNRGLFECISKRRLNREYWKKETARWYNKVEAVQAIPHGNINTDARGHQR